MRGKQKTDPMLRFLGMVSVDRNSGCWEWLGHVKATGYAELGVGGRSYIRLHRFAYERFKGPIPSGLEIDHLCRNRRCANPDHLEAVTPRENVLRGTGPIPENAAKTHCWRGHPFTEENTYTQRSGDRVRGRGCRECHRIQGRESDRRRREKKRAKKAAQPPAN